MGRIVLGRFVIPVEPKDRSDPPGELSLGRVVLIPHYAVAAIQI